MSLKASSVAAITAAVALVFAKTNGTPTAFSMTAGIKAPKPAGEYPAAIGGASCLLVMEVAMVEKMALSTLPPALRKVPMRPADTPSSS